MASRLVLLLLALTALGWCEGPPRMDGRGGQFELYTGRRSRQSFEDYSDGRFNQPRPGRRTIVLVPYGDGDFSRDQRGLTRFLEAFFQLPVRWEKARPLGARASGSKYSADQIQRELRRSLPSDALAMLALTQVDLYAEDAGPGHLLFGQGHYFNRTAVASMNRLSSQQASLRHHRLYKLVAHELLHTLNLRHCRRYRCLLNSSASVTQSDRRPLHLCPECLAKLEHAVGFDVEARYSDLVEATSEARPEDREWFAARLAFLRR